MITSSMYASNSGGWPICIWVQVGYGNNGMFLYRSRTNGKETLVKSMGGEYFYFFCTNWGVCVQLQRNDNDDVGFVFHPRFFGIWLPAH